LHFKGDALTVVRLIHQPAILEHLVAQHEGGLVEDDQVYRPPTTHLQLDHALDAIHEMFLQVETRLHKGGDVNVTVRGSFSFCPRAKKISRNHLWPVGKKFFQANLKAFQC